MKLKLMVLFAVLALTTSAQAKDMTGRFGVGADTTLGFATNGPSNLGGFLGARQESGLSLVYQATSVFGLQMILSTQVVTSTVDGSDASATDLGLALRGILVLLSRGDLAVQGVGGLSYRSVSADNNQGMEVFDASDLSIEFGIRPEWFVSSYLSLHTQIGLAISIINEDDNGLTDGGTSVNLFDVETLTGSAGFTFYF